MSGKAEAIRQEYRCPSCGRIYRSKYNFRKHLRAFHPDLWLKEVGRRWYVADVEFVLSCRFCGRKYLTPEGLDRHLRLRHPEKYAEYAGRAGE
jgi:uncharacterized C2H2 Zn-finger protein